MHGRNAGSGRAFALRDGVQDETIESNHCRTAEGQFEETRTD